MGEGANERGQFISPSPPHPLVVVAPQPTAQVEQPPVPQPPASFVPQSGPQPAVSVSVNLRNCTRASGVGGYVTHFVDPSRPNQAGSQWQFRENIILEHPEHGELVLDILTDNRVGAVEFLTRLLRAMP